MMEVTWGILCIFLLLVLYGGGQEPSNGKMQSSGGNAKQADSVKLVPPIHPVSNSPTVVSMDRPTRLVISAIHLDVAVEMVGLKADGELDTPQERPLDDVGWYSMGPRPGERGSAVIDGHLDRPGGSPAVFWYLSHLQTRDNVTVMTSQGRTVHFRVTHLQTYQPQNAPLQAIFADRSGNYLNLITCAGSWLASEHQTTQRLVVYTSLVE